MEKKWLGVDLGEKRIGLAVSDKLGMLAHPLRTLAFTTFANLVHDLICIIKEEQIYGLVVGVPYTMKGTLSKKTEEILTITDKIKKQIPVPVELIDERLTTRMAEASLHAVGKKTGKNRNKIDQIAAVHLLQNFLDSHKRKT